MINRCSFEGCEKNPAINGNGRCRVHGGRTRCNDLGCSSFAKKGGKCGKHLLDRRTCSAKDCYKLPVRNGICIAHGAIRLCKILECELPLFQSGKCCFHFNNSMVTFPRGDVCTPINTLANLNTPIVLERGVERDYHYVMDATQVSGNGEGIGDAEVNNSMGVVSPINNDIMGEEDFGSSMIDFNNYVEESTTEIVAVVMITMCNQPTSKTFNYMTTIIDIPDLPLGNIQDYVGMNNWEHVIAFGAVCKTWRAASKHHLAKVGIAHMEVGRRRKLCVTGFLNYLHQDKCRFAEKIYVPCGKKTDGPEGRHNFLPQQQCASRS
jgi:hypothetical protein